MYNEDEHTTTTTTTKKGKVVLKWLVKWFSDITLLTHSIVAAGSFISTHSIYLTCSSLFIYPSHTLTLFTCLKCIRSIYIVGNTKMMKKSDEKEKKNGCKGKRKKNMAIVYWLQNCTFEMKTRIHQLTEE